VGEHRTLGGFYPVLHGEKVISEVEEQPPTSAEHRPETYDRST